MGVGRGFNYDLVWNAKERASFNLDLERVPLDSFRGLAVGAFFIRDKEGGG